MCLSRPLLVHLHTFHITIQLQIEKVLIVGFGIRTRAAGWEAQTDPLSYGFWSGLLSNRYFARVNAKFFLQKSFGMAGF